MPKLVAHAVVREDPPRVYIAEDETTLNWVLALRVVAQSSPQERSEEVRIHLREAILDERWGEAVELWIKLTGTEIDVYTSTELTLQSDTDLSAAEIQFSPLFRDLGPGIE